MSHMDEWDAEKMFNLYLLDLLVKRNMHETAEIFTKEAKIDSSLPVIDSLVGFLYEWWVVFFDSYFSQQVAQEVANEQAKNKGKQIIESQNESQDHQSQALKIEIAKLLGQLEANSLVPKTFELEQLTHNTGGSASTSQFPTSGFPDLDIATGSNICNNEPQLLLPTQDKMMLNLGSIANDLDLGAMKAIFGLHDSVNVDMEHVMNSSTLQGWPLHGAGQVSPYMGKSVITSYLQQSNLVPQIQLPTTSSEQEFLAEPMEWMDYTPGCGSPIPSLPRSSFDLNTRNLMDL